MKHAAFLLSLCVASASASVAGAGSVVVTIDTQAEPRPISDFIYGSNHEVEGHMFRAARRLGGNRLSAYNWRIDASNAGKDYRHNSDQWLTRQTWWQATAGARPVRVADDKAGAVHRFHEESLARGSYSLVTVPLAGFVVADADGPVEASEATPSRRWTEVEDGQAFTRHLVDTYGGAGNARGIRGFSLGNEPALWHKTHPRMRREAVTCEELLQRSVRTAQAIKRADADAEVFGPALWGMTAYASLSKATDWPAEKKRGGYDWFIDAYLDRMSQASERAGVRLLDVLDVHWYTEAPKGREWTGEEAARSAKALYDAKHTEPNWVGKHFGDFLPLLPRLQESIDRYYPGTKIAITEYDWPMTGTVYGGLTQADALGAFGKHGVYFASYHHYTHDKPDRYVGSAFALYRNYDGQGASFGRLALPATVDGMGDADFDVYASTDSESGAVHVVVIHRGEGEARPVELRLDGMDTALTGRTFYFDADSPDVRPGPPLESDSDGSVTLSVPTLSAWHVVLTLSEK
ncbi:MAG: glycoside hydrolase family 44 protein [Planctomycetota bacterium]